MHNASDVNSKFIPIFGTKIHYTEAGKGDPFLFIHGNPTSSYLWRNIIPSLQQEGRCIAVDLVGMGKSGKPKIEYRFSDHAKFLECFILELGLKNITLVAHDWGGVLAFDFARRHPEKVRGIAFMETILEPFTYESMGPYAEVFKKMRTPGIGEKMVFENNFFVCEMLPGAIIRKLSEEELSTYASPFENVESRLPLLQWPREVPIDGEPKDLTKIVEENSQWLKKSSIPKLLIHAQPGAIVPQQLVEKVRYEYPNLTIKDVGAGIHYIQEDRPEEIGQALFEWYKNCVKNLNEEK
jgi:haloalkane dehalogenase